MGILLGFLLILLIVATVKTCDAAGLQAEQTIAHHHIIVPKLDSHKFQLNFLQALNQHINDAAAKYIDAYLMDLLKNEKFLEYQQEFVDILNNYSDDYNNNNHYHYSKNKAIDEKIVFVKQLLDVQHARGDYNAAEDEAVEIFYTLKNTIFLKNLRQLMDELQEQSEQLLREFRINELCLQFQEEKLEAKSDRHLSELNHRHLAPLINAKHDSEIVSTAKPRSRFISLQHYGSAVYERIKAAGSEIIDDYLNTVRKLLQEVIDEQPDNVRHSEKLNKVLHEIVAVMEIGDFAQKRERLYNYLQTNLTLDYELFQSTEHSQRDLAEIMLKLKSRGLDMFFNFLVSNFAFLEHLQKEWGHVIATLDDDGGEDFKQLREIARLYVIFKQNTENPKKFDAYMASVDALYERVQLMPTDAGLKIYEILHNSSQNVGSVTLNMIKSKCDLG